MEPTTEIVNAVAATAGKQASELPPLADTVDPDALNGLLSGESQACVSFTYCGHYVIADGNEVSVEPERTVCRAVRGP